MMAEWQLNGDVKDGFQSHSATIQWPYSRLNGRHISVTSQSAYFFEKLNYAQYGSNTGWTSQGKYANHLATRTVRDSDEYLVFV